MTVSLQNGENSVRRSGGTIDRWMGDKNWWVARPIVSDVVRMGLATSGQHRWSLRILRLNASVGIHYPTSGVSNPGGLRYLSLRQDLQFSHSHPANSCFAWTASSIRIANLYPRLFCTAPKTPRQGRSAFQ
jgi:hypothetical protein